MPRIAGAADPEASVMKARYDEHAAVLWRYALWLTDDASRAEDVVQETLLRAWQPPEVTCDAERSARAWLFTVARNMIVDGSRSAPSGNVVSSLDDSSNPEWSAPDEVNAALDRLLIADAQLLAEHRTVIDPLLPPGMDHDTARRRLGIAEGTVKSRLHYAVRALRVTLQGTGATPWRRHGPFGHRSAPNTQSGQAIGLTPRPRYGTFGRPSASNT